MSKKQFLLLAVLLAGVSAYLGYLVRPPLVDDAFITFRYAANIANGKGFSYNAGDPVLGVTTPLWALLLAQGLALGLKPDSLAVIISILAAAALAVCFGLFMAEAVGRAAALAAIPLQMLFFYNHAAIFCGMETSIYTLAVFASFMLLEKHRDCSALAAAALAALIRIDGGLALLVVGCAIMARDRRLPIYKSLPALLILLPWFAFSAVRFGSLLPHSIAAKQLFHPGGALANLLYMFEAFALHPADYFLFIIGAAGLIFRALRGKLWFLLWLVLYMAGLVFSGIKPVFFWYYTPIWCAVLTFGLLGVLEWYRERPAYRRRTAALAYLTAALCLIGFSLPRAGQPDPAMLRNATYQTIAADFKERIAAGELLYVCETGVLGYYFLNNPIMDASGINSTSVYRIRREAVLRGEPAEGQEREKEILAAARPAWIISPRRGLCPMARLEEDPWFSGRYETAALYTPEHLGGIAVYKAR